MYINKIMSTLTIDNNRFKQIQSENNFRKSKLINSVGSCDIVSFKGKTLYTEPIKKLSAELQNSPMVRTLIEAAKADDVEKIFNTIGIKTKRNLDKTLTISEYTSPKDFNFDEIGINEEVLLSNVKKISNGASFLNVKELPLLEEVGGYIFFSRELSLPKLRKSGFMDLRYARNLDNYEECSGVLRCDQEYNGILKKLKFVDTLFIENCNLRSSSKEPLFSLENVFPALEKVNLLKIYTTKGLNFPKLKEIKDALVYLYECNMEIFPKDLKLNEPPIKGYVLNLMNHC